MKVIRLYLLSDSSADSGHEISIRLNLDGSEYVNACELDDAFLALRSAVDKRLIEEKKEADD